MPDNTNEELKLVTKYGIVGTEFHQEAGVMVSIFLDEYEIFDSYEEALDLARELGLQEDTWFSVVPFTFPEPLDPDMEIDFEHCVNMDRAYRETKINEINLSDVEKNADCEIVDIADVLSNRP